MSYPLTAAEAMSEPPKPDAATLITQLTTVRPRLQAFFNARGCGLESEDLASETIARVLSHVSERRLVRNVPAFSYGVARNVWLEHVRHRRRIETVGDVVLCQLVEKMSQRSPDNRLFGTVLECLRDLDPRRLEEFIEYHLGPGTNARRRAAMAARLGISQGALQSRISATRLKLRHDIQLRRQQR